MTTQAVIARLSQKIAPTRLMARAP
jgi:hypothetical protein